MTTPMSVYARIAERYGVDSRDDEAVDELFLTTAPALPEAERERVLNELLESSSRPSERKALASPEETLLELDVMLP